MELANDALNGSYVPANGSASLSDINAALDAIINAFHGGKYFARFEDFVTGCKESTPSLSRINVASPVEDVNCC